MPYSYDSHIIKFGKKVIQKIPSKLFHDYLPIIETCYIIIYLNIWFSISNKTIKIDFTKHFHKELLLCVSHVFAVNLVLHQRV